jgi:eukaryotic-like serine/threonine-protein kinase
VAEVAQLMVPVQFGRYVLVERIGRGGMAEVFRAVMPGAEGFRRTFVVKRILAELSQANDFVDMFVREARIGALLNHPSIVQMYDFGNVEGNYFLAMEYLRGRDVAAVLRRLRQVGQRCPIAVAAYVAREVAECLGYAHALVGADGKPLNIVHRDVSPSNIMCLTTGGVKLLDFGIAKAIGDTAFDRTERGAFKGKLSYMAPERIRRQPFDARSDLFSLGVVLWEMLAGRRLFRGASDAETLRNVTESEVVPPSSLRPDVPAALDFVVMRALERDPDRRYPSGQAMADDLEDVLTEARFQAKMLPALLRDLFGDALQTNPVGFTRQGSELVDVSGTPELVDITGERAAARAPLDGTGTPASSLPTLPSVEVKIEPRNWQRVASGAAAATATAVLLALLFARGGGARSQATTLSVPRAPVPAQVVRPAVVPLAPAPAPSAAAAPAEPADDDAAAPPAARDKPAEAASGKRSSHAHAQAGKGRIARGLSIDPFAEAAARRGR